MMTSSMSPMNRLSYQRFQQPKQQSQITYDVKYDFTNSEDERIQVFRYTATVEKTGGTTRLLKSRRPKKFGRTLNPMILMINEGEFNL